MKPTKSVKRVLLNSNFESTSLIARIVKFNRLPKCNLQEVFTPTKAATLTFVERKAIEYQINKALLLPGMQAIVYGHSGSGKTTVTINVLKNNNVKYIVTNCSKDNTIDQLMLDAFDQLRPFYVSEISEKLNQEVSAELKANYFSIDSTIKAGLKMESSEVLQRALPMQLTPQRLADLLGAAGVVWVIEDFHKVNIEERKKLSSILKIFVDKANTYSSVKVIAIGAVDTAREVINYGSDLANRVSEIHVPLMTKEEMEVIIRKGERLLNVVFNEQIHSNIILYSNSLASICHHLCFSICYKNGIVSTQKNRITFTEYCLQDAVASYLQQNSDSFKEIFDRALKHRDGKYDNTRQIVKTVCKINKDELTAREILNYGGNKRMYSGSINQYLRLLTTVDYGEILRYDENAGRYSFSTPFYKAYAIMRFTDEEKGFDIKESYKFRFEDLIQILKSIEGRV